MSGWRYIAQRLPDGAFLDYDLPLQDVQLTRTLSGPDALSATIPVEVAHLKGADGNPILHEWGTAIYAERDGEIRGGFILVHSSFEDSRWQLEGMGFVGYATDLPYADSKYFVEADPLDIVRHIWEHIQAQRDGNLNLVVDDTKSPVRIGTALEQVEFDSQAGPVSFEAGPKMLNWYTTENLGREIEDLAVATPFEYVEEHAWDGDIILHRLRLYYPYKGTRRNDLRFVFGENIHDLPKIERDGDLFANEVLLLGAGEGRAMVRGQVARPDGRLRRVAVVADKAIKSTSEAARRADLELISRQGLDDVTSISVRDHANAPLGSWDVGDEIFVEGETDWVDFASWCRILSFTMSPDGSDVATMTIARTDTVVE